MRILWLKTELLHPIDKGGKIRTYQMMKELKKNHQITYLTLDDGTAEADALEKSSEYAHEVITVPHSTSAKFSLKFYGELVQNIASSLPYALQKYVSEAMRKKIAEIATPENFDVVVCDFLTPAVNLPTKISIPTLLFQHNVEAQIWQRHFVTQINPAKKTFFKTQFRKMFDYEKEACRRFDFVSAVSEEDAQKMREDYSITNVEAVPTGVDTEFFAPSLNAEKDEFNLVFTGSMDWLPNEDAIKWFTEEIFPLIKKSVPQVTLTVVGRNPFASLVELSKKDSSIVVTGRVPDVRPLMEKAAVYIVPIRIGGGTRIKIYEALAMEIPMVSTTVGAEGLPVRDGEHLLLRDTAESFAEAVILLLENRQKAHQLAENAAQYVRQNFSWATVTNAFAKHCEKALKNFSNNRN